MRSRRGHHNRCEVTIIIIMKIPAILLLCGALTLPAVCVAQATGGTTDKKELKKVDKSKSDDTKGKGKGKGGDDKGKGKSKSGDDKGGKK